MTAPHVFDQDTAVTLASGFDRKKSRQGGHSPVESGGEGPVVLRAELSKRWWIERGPNGGYVAAVMQRAMQQVAGERPPRSMTVQFAAAPVEGAVEIEVRTVRRGRTVTFLSALMRQGERSILSAIAVFGDDREPTLEYDSAEALMPAEAGEPGELMPAPDTPGVPAVFQNFEARLALGEVPLSGGEQARTGAWIRTREPRLMDAALATAVLDVWLPAPFVKLTEPAPVPTLDLTYHFRGQLPLPEARPDDPYLIDVRSSLARGGYFEEDARLWHPNGTLIAHSRQLALL